MSTLQTGYWLPQGQHSCFPGRHGAASQGYSTPGCAAPDVYRACHTMAQRDEFLSTAESNVIIWLVV